MIVHLASGPLDTHYGLFTEHLYYDGMNETIALVMGEVTGAERVPCRLHSACITAHAFNSLECDCREQMAMAQERIQREGRGIIIWLSQEGRGNGHLALVATSSLRRENIPQSQAYEKLGFASDRRDYRAAVGVLHHLSPSSVILLTNSPSKKAAITDGGISVAGTETLTLDPNSHPLLALAYADKKRRGHSVP
jgi:GTP cyclohydrolase II